MPPTLPNTLTNGQTADASHVMANLNAINAAVDQATVTSLPGSPYDGQEVYYLADAANGVVWHLKYRAASASAYKWECVGGAALRAEVETGETTTSTAYVDLATVGPSSTAPLGGDYDLHFGAQMYGPAASGAWMTVKIGAAAAADNDGIWQRVDAGQLSLARERRFAGIAAGTVLKAQYRSNTAGTSYFASRFLFARPVRVG